MKALHAIVRFASATLVLYLRGIRQTLSAFLLEMRLSKRTLDIPKRSLPTLLLFAIYGSFFIRFYLSKQSHQHRLHVPWYDLEILTATMLPGLDFGFCIARSYSARYRSGVIWFPIEDSTILSMLLLGMTDARLKTAYLTDNIHFNIACSIFRSCQRSTSNPMRTNSKHRNPWHCQP